LSTSQAAALTTAQVNAMETTDLQFLATTQVQALSTSVISALLALQFEAFTSSQVAGLRTPRTITESLSVRVRPSDSGGRGSRSTQTGVVASHDRRGRYSIPLGDCGEQT
jgi:hypothetical protein